MKDKLPPHRFGPGYDLPFQEPPLSRVLGSGKASYMNDRTTHSVGIRPHPKSNAIAKALLQATVKKLDDAVAAGYVPEYTIDNRMLIDKVHEATFYDPPGLQWIDKDKRYELRGLLRKAKCFNIDDQTSELIADFSRAIGADLDSARRMAIPPFPITWIDHNNQKRIARVRELGGQLTPRAAGELEGPPVERVGWLIHPAEMGGHYMTYFCEVDQGMMMAPLSYWWHNDAARPVPAGFRQTDMDDFLHGLTLGVARSKSNCDPVDAFPGPTPMHIKTIKHYPADVRDLMAEISGELRHVWGLLIAIASSQFGMETEVRAQEKHTDIRKAPNGKPLLPLEHKIMHLYLRKRVKPERAILRAMTHHRMRWHEVRGHLRTLRNADGSVRRIIPIKPHERGDKKLGSIIRDETKVEL